MNKLVSRNPVLRFKLGRKIVKALQGLKVIATVDGRQFETTIEQARRNGWEYFIPSEQAEFNRKYPYDYYSTEYSETSPYFPAFIQDARFGDYVNGWRGETSDYPSGLIHDLEKGNLAFLPRKIRVPYVPTLRSQNNSLAQNVNLQNNSSTQNVDTQNTQSKTTESLTQSKPNFLNNKSGSQKFTKGKSRKTSITPSVFAGHRIGRTGGLDYNINYSDKQLLIGTGQFTESDFINALAALLALNRYFANSGLGSVKEDNYWGDLSRAALALALSKSKGLTPLNNETTIVKTPVAPIYTPPTTPNLNLNIPTYVTADRSQTRDWMRSNNIDPYSVTGAMRAAARRIRAGQANDNDKLLVKGNEQLYNLLKGYYKQGGLLPSRNIVKRFKQRNFRLVDQ